MSKDKKTVKTKINNTTQQKESRKNYFFNGIEGLQNTFWWYFIGANVMILVTVLNFFTLGVEDTYAFYLVIFISIMWNILAIMGVFNAADIYKAEKIKKGLDYGWATAAKISCVILILSAIVSNIPKLKSFPSNQYFLSKCVICESRIFQF